MILTIKNHDIFSLSNGSSQWFFAHCISSDLVLGNGMALEFSRHFPELHSFSSSIIGERVRDLPNVGTCMVVGPTLNLITRRTVHDKQTHENLSMAILDMRHVVTKRAIKNIAMPILRDEDDWAAVCDMIVETFRGIEVEFMACF